MTDVNFIITCFDREAYWPYLKKIISSYKNISPRVAFCYNGADKNLPCDYRCKNEGKARGDARLIAGGYDLLKSNSIQRWVKLSVDSWPCLEEKLLGLFDRMEKAGKHYAGIPWHLYNYQYSTDVIIADGAFMRAFVSLFGAVYSGAKSLEATAKDAVARLGGAYFIKERLPYQRHHVVSLGWTMQHDLKDNIELARKWGAPC